MNINELIIGLPGEDLVRRGLADYQEGRRSAESFLVQIARPRLENCGLLPPDESAAPVEHELELYRLLRQEGDDAYARYNALLGELVSFEMALDRRVREARQNEQRMEAYAKISSTGIVQSGNAAPA